MGMGLILVTPTYKREGRVDYLRRAIQTVNTAKAAFDHFNRKLQWIIVEDDGNMDEIFRLVKKECILTTTMTFVGPTNDKGHAQRNRAFEHIVDVGWADQDYIVYNMDDDNKVDPKLLLQICSVERFGVCPIGNLGPGGVEGPIMHDGKVVDFNAGWKERKFPIDMGSFAFNAKLLLDLDSPYWEHVGTGGESEFIEKLNIPIYEFELITPEVKVWHNEPL